MTIEITLIERGKRYGSLAGHARITQGIKREIQGFVKYEGDATRPWDKLSDDKKEALDMIAAGRNQQISWRKCARRTSRCRSLFRGFLCIQKNESNDVRKIPRNAYKGDGKTTTFHVKFTSTAMSVSPEMPYTIKGNTVTFVKPPKKGQVICLKSQN